MEKIIMQRGYGKTTQLIKKSAKSGDYIVCHRLDEANRIQYEAQQMGLDIPLPIRLLSQRTKFNFRPIRNKANARPFNG